MARAFVKASSQYLENASAVLTAAPITIAAWAYSDNAVVAQHAIGLGSTSELDVFALRLMGNQAGDPLWALTSNNGSWAQAVTTTGYSTNTWHHICGVFAAADDRRAYIDGGSKGTDSTSTEPTAIDTTSLGVYVYNGSRSNYLSGQLAEVAIWNAALSDAEVAILATGFSPLFVHPENLVAYWPLIRDEDQDRVGGYDLTAYNSPTVANHPPIIYPAPPFLGLGSGAAPPAVTPKLLAMLGVG